MEENYIYIYYLNDEQTEVFVQVNHAFFFDPNDPTKQPNIKYTKLRPAEGKLFKIEVSEAEGFIPYVKKWKGKVLLTYQDLRATWVQESRHIDDED